MPRYGMPMMEFRNPKFHCRHTIPWFQDSDFSCGIEIPTNLLLTELPCVVGLAVDTSITRVVNSIVTGAIPVTMS